MTQLERALQGETTDEVRAVAAAVEIAAKLVRELDEPTAGLDPVREYRMMHLPTLLSRDKGVTIVMAIHSVDVVPLYVSLFGGTYA